MIARAPRLLLDVDDRAVCARVRHDEGTEFDTPIVLAAGGTGGGTDGQWGRASEELLAPLGPLVTYDRAGSGRSDGPPHATVAGMARELDAVIDGLGLSVPVVLVAASLGAFPVEGMLVHHASRVAGVVLIDPTPTEPPPSSVATRTLVAVSKPLVRVVALASWAGAFSGTLGERIADLMASADGTPEGRAQALAVLRDPGVLDGHAQMMDLVPAYSAELGAALDSVALPDVPVTVISARRRGGYPADYVATIEAAHARLTARFPRGRLVEARDAGHAVTLDAPGLVADEVRALLAGLRRG